MSAHLAFQASWNRPYTNPGPEKSIINEKVSGGIKLFYLDSRRILHHAPSVLGALRKTRLKSGFCHHSEKTKPRDVIMCDLLADFSVDLGGGARAVALSVARLGAGGSAAGIPVVVAVEDRDLSALVEAGLWR